MTTQTLGKYQLIKKLATGGMAEVWLAKQTGIEGFERHVVIKRILPHLAEDPEFVQMFLNEAKIASRFNHQNIAQIYDLGEVDGTYFIAMEFVHGEDLGRLMRRAWTTEQWLAQPLALRMIADACAGLHYAHTRTDESGRPLKVVHRDISPQNILISFDGSVKLVDFGIAKAANSVSQTRSGAIKGKFAYMAPEQAAGSNLDARADIFAIGLVLYELITGVRPLKRDSELATLQAALECAIAPPSEAAEVAADVDEVVMKALAKKPEDRYADARQFQMAIEGLLVTQGALATTVQISDLMEHLFADRRAEEARLGAPNPSTESSTGNRSVEMQLPKQATPVSRGSNLSLSATEMAAPAPKYTGETNSEVDESTEAIDSSNVEVVEEEVPKRRSSKAIPRASNPPAAKAKSDPSAAPARRKSSANVKKAPTNAGNIPAAKVGKSKASLERVAARASTPAPVMDDSTSADDSNESGGSKSKLMLIGVGALVALMVVAFVVRRVIGSNAARGTPVKLTVHTTPSRLKVVVHPPDGDDSRPEVVLGETPLDEVSGAYLGDTVVIERHEQGLHAEMLVNPAVGSDTQVIERTFQEGTLRVRTKPALRGGLLYAGQSQVGAVGIPTKLYEGLLRLEIRSQELKEPVKFEVKLGPNQILEHEVDVSTKLVK